MALAVFTKNSVYVLDQEAQTYTRIPRGDPQVVLSDRLVYEESLPYREFRLDLEGCPGAPWPHLHLWAPDSVKGIITSPLDPLTIDSILGNDEAQCPD